MLEWDIRLELTSPLATLRHGVGSKAVPRDKALLLKVHWSYHVVTKFGSFFDCKGIVPII